MNQLKINNDFVVDNVVDIGESFEEKAPRTKEHLAVYCATVLNNRFPWPESDNEECKQNGHRSPLDAIWAAYAELDDFSIWYAMRGSGKTYDLSILSWIESLFKPKCGTTVLGGSLEQSTRAVGYLTDLWNMPGVPHYMLVGGTVTGRGFKLKNGSWVKALAASTKSVRGPHPQKLRLDELDEMEENIYNSSLGQPKSNYGIKDNVVISSTLHKPFGLMTEVIDSRIEKGMELYQWCINEVLEPRGFWTKDEFERKKRHLTKAMLDSEYYLKRPQVGDSIFDFDGINRAYFRGIKDFWEKKIKTEAGIDWGYKCTVINLIQNHKEFYSIPISKSWDNYELVDRCNEIADLCIEYKITTIYCDSNPKDATITLRKILSKKKATFTKIIPIAFNKWKNISINVIRFLLERNLINISDKILQDKMKKYHYKNADQEVIEKDDDHYPDALIAWAASKTNLLGR